MEIFECPFARVHEYQREFKYCIIDCSSYLLVDLEILIPSHPMPYHPVHLDLQAKNQDQIQEARAQEKPRTKGLAQH
jgi:hypothetical protein